MFKKIMLSTSLLFAALTSSAQPVQEVYLTTSSSGIDFNFDVNQAIVFTNTFPWILKANCQITCNETVRNRMQATVLKKNGTLNNMPMEKGDQLCLDIYNQDMFSMTATTGAKVEIKNIGEGPIKVTCTIVNN
jgi:hypothetical protein